MRKRRSKKSDKQGKKLLVPSGSTMLNLCCSDTTNGAFQPGKIVTIPGGSASGKTILTLTILAEVCYKSAFDDYRLVYDDAEFASSFDIPKLFGERLPTRLESPYIDDDDLPVYSNTIQDFKMNVVDECKKKEPFIWILDSLDTLTSDEEMEREYKALLARAKSKEAVKALTGSYKTEKAKLIGEALRMINGKIDDSKSLLIIVRQTRANIGFSQKKWVTSGGQAPYYYSHHEVWLDRIGGISRQVKNIPYKVATHNRAKVTKNKLTGKERFCLFDIHPSYGIDDINSCIDFLLTTKHWRKGESWLGLDEKLTRAAVVDEIENSIELYKRLKEEVQSEWDEIEEKIALKRKRRFE